MRAKTCEMFERISGNKQPRLLHPTATKFSRANLETALQSISNPTERDQDIAEAMNWVSHQLQLLRTQTSHLIDELSTEDAILLAVAQVNRQYTHIATAAIRSASKQAKKDGALDLNRAGRSLVPNLNEGAKATPDDIIELSLDMMPHWLYRAVNKPDGPVKNIKDDNLELRGNNTSLVLSIETSLNSLWQNVLWANWRLNFENDRLTIEPTDQESEIQKKIWLWRQQDLLMQYFFTYSSQQRMDKEVGLSASNRVYRTVSSVTKKSGQKTKFNISLMSEGSSQAHGYLIDISILESSYVSIFLDEKLPLVDISCRSLQQAWCVIRDVADAMSRYYKVESRARKGVNHRNLREFALSMSRSTLIDVLTKSLSLTSNEAARVVNFFTYDPTDGSFFRKGLWSAPVVRLPCKKQIAICHTALRVSLPVRRVEHWLERGGLSDQFKEQSKGLNFERQLRTSLIEAIENNGLLIDAACLPESLSPSDEEVGDIDLVVRLGSTLLVGEVKCLLWPTEPLEHHNYWTRMEAAAEQAERKTDWVRNNLIDLRERLGLSDSVGDLNVYPIVVVNNGFGIGEEVEGVVIVDHIYLSLYIGNGRYRSRALTNLPKRETVEEWTTLYEDQAGAEMGLLASLKKPAVLERFRGSIHRFESEFMAPDGTRAYWTSYKQGERGDGYRTELDDYIDNLGHS